jgi:hypothetical protein
MDHSDGEKGSDADRETLPADHEVAVFFLEPRKHPPRLEARHLHCDWPSTRLSPFPDPLRNPGPEAPLAALLAQRFGLVSFVRREAPGACARSAALSRADVQGIQPRDDRGPLAPIGGRRARGQRHTRGVREAMDQDPLTVPPGGDGFTAAFARGKTRRRPPHPAIGGAPGPRRDPAGGLLCRPGGQRAANAAATAARRFSRPMAERAGDRTSGRP